MITQETESRLDDIYSSAFATVLRRNSAVFHRIRAIMDGEMNPPRYCVTDKQKERWRERQLLKILKASNIEKDLTAEIQKAGDRCEAEIEKMREDVYTAAYEDTMNRLRR